MVVLREPVLHAPETSSVECLFIIMQSPWGVIALGTVVHIKVTRVVLNGSSVIPETFLQINYL